MLRTKTLASRARGRYALHMAKAKSDIKGRGNAVAKGVIPPWLVGTKGNRKMDDGNKSLAIMAFAEHGTYAAAARAAQVTTVTIKDNIKSDPDFEEAMLEAYEQFRDSIEIAIRSRAIEGWDEPVFSHKTGTQIGTVRKFSDGLLTHLSKRHIPEYRDKGSMDVNVTGGVLLVGARPSQEEWASQYNRPLSDVIEGEAVVIKDSSPAG